jgi:signal transduction histidine kinase
MPDRRHIRDNLRGDTGRLAATYLAIIISLTIVFSSVIYAISASQFNGGLSPHGQAGSMSQFDDFTRGSLQELFEERAKQARADLFWSLLLLNLAVFIGGAFFSYYLARKSLEPIEAAMDSQRQFVSDASHELRTPLTALQITNEVALRKKSLTLAQAKELIGHTLAETIKLRNLSEALLGLAKQEGIDTTKQSVHLPEVVLATVETLKPLADEKHITIATDVPDIDVTANSAALTQIIRILLDNAIKYSPADSTVSVSAEQSEDGTTVSVADNGPGIASEHQEKIFDRFYRVDESRSSQNIGGSGLGLAIAKAAAVRNDLDLAVESQPGGGSRFSVRIPH